MQSNLFAFKNFLALAFILWFGYVAWGARNFPFLAKVLPFYVGVFLFLLGIVELFLQLRRTSKTAEQEGGSLSDLSASWDISFELVWRRFFVFFTMILLLYGCFWILGYPLTMTLFIFLFYRFAAGASWWASVVAGFSGLAFLALASHVLGMQWPEGLITLPWPLG
jgi:hypothetical protein